MSCDDFVAAEHIRPFQQSGKFHCAVAVDAGIRRLAAQIALHELPDHLFAELLREVEHIMPHTEPEGDRTGILRVIERAAGLVGHGGIGIVKELHRAADALVSRLLRQKSGHAGIDAAAHRNQCTHHVEQQCGSSDSRNCSGS